MRINCIFLILMCLMSVLDGRAQGMTFHHDPSIMNQFTVMETGVGGLTPPDYYTTLHKNYYRWANVNNKNLSRIEFGRDVDKQVGKADTIKSALKRRAIVAGWDQVSQDPSLDAAWKIEGPKIEAKMDMLYKNIGRIIPKGGSSDDQKIWVMNYRCLVDAIRIIQKSTLTHGQRQTEYVAIYRQIVGKLSLLSKKLSEWEATKMVKAWNKSGTPIKRTSTNGTLAYGSLLSWQSRWKGYEK